MAKEMSTFGIIYQGADGKVHSTCGTDINKEACAKQIRLYQELGCEVRYFSPNVTKEQEELLWNFSALSDLDRQDGVSGLICRLTSLDSKKDTEIMPAVDEGARKC